MNDPFEHLDFERELDPANWLETDILHTPTLEAHLTEERTLLTMHFPSGHQETLARGDIEALTRFLQAHVQVAPLVADESVLQDFHPLRVDE